MHIILSLSYLKKKSPPTSQLEAAIAYSSVSMLKYITISSEPRSTAEKSL